MQVPDVYDTSFNRPRPRELPTGSGVILYVSHDPANDKIPSPAECDAYRNAGHPVGFVFEWYETRATEDYQAGLTDGTAALVQVQQRGHESWRPVYVAADSPLHVSASYLNGFRDGLQVHEPGLYSGGYNLNRARAMPNPYRKLWQAKSAAWGQHTVDDNGNLILTQHPYASLVQLMDTNVPGTDRNTVRNMSWNQTLVTPTIQHKDRSHQMVLVLKRSDGGKSALWIDGGIAVPSVDNTTRESFKAAGGLVFSADDNEWDQYTRGFRIPTT